MDRLTHDHFLRAIAESPDDDSLRLIFADWLEENGDAAFARFIRVQCELARSADENEHWLAQKIEEEALWVALKGRWQPDLEVCRSTLDDFDRGLLGEVGCHVAELDEFLQLPREMPFVFGIHTITVAGYPA